MSSLSASHWFYRLLVSRKNDYIKGNAPDPSPQKGGGTGYTRLEVQHVGAKIDPSGEHYHEVEPDLTDLTSWTLFGDRRLPTVPAVRDKGNQKRLLPSSSLAITVVPVAQVEITKVLIKLA